MKALWELIKELVVVAAMTAGFILAGLLMTNVSLSDVLDALRTALVP